MPVKASPHRYQFATHPESAHRHTDYSWIGGIVHFFLKRLLIGFIKTTTSGHHLLTRSPFNYRFVENSLIFHAKGWKWFIWPAWILVEADTTSPKRGPNPHSTGFGSLLGNPSSRKEPIFI
jgi:hypothetical protein